MIFFGGRNRLHTRHNSKSQYHTGVRSASDEAGIRRFPDDEDEKRAALLADLDENDDLNPGRGYDEDNSSQENSGHSYQKLKDGRESVNSVESYDTTSSGHTVRYTTATDFSTSYRPHFAHEKRGQHGRKSESMNYLSGSIIVNALMWPIAHGQRNSTNSQPSSHSNSRERMSADAMGGADNSSNNDVSDATNDAHTLSNTLHNTH